MAKTKKTAVIVGYGGQGRYWHSSIKKHDGWELIGIVDTDTEMLDNIGSITGGALDDDMGYISIEDCVRYGEKPDLAINSTPNYAHHGITIEIMDLGINVVTEKNMAGTLVQGKQMVQMALDHPELCTAVGTQSRYGMGPWTMKCFIEECTGPDAEIGELAYIDIEDYGYRGARRWGWRRFLEDIYLDDVGAHTLDRLRYITGMEYTQIQASTFIMRGKGDGWYGSTTAIANMGMARPEDFHDRHKWVWVRFAGDWGRHGPTNSKQDYAFTRGRAKISQWGVETMICNDPYDSRKYEEDGYLPRNDIEGLENMAGQQVILEQMSRGIDSGGEKQPGTNFCEAFKSFAATQAFKESSYTGKAVWVPDYWKHFLN
ncbi:MAG: Gfo/Idh/MocA family protein [Candidatus Hodarchaeota archaeon]